MKHSIRIPIASACLVLASVAGAVWAHQTSESGPPLNQLYPGPLGLADFGKIISGEFTGDWKRDAVVMDGAQPKMLVAPETFDTAIAMGGAANDIVVLPGVSGGKDRILAVGASGLVRYERTSTSGWIEYTIGGPTSVWGNARLVAVGELDGTGAADIVGIGANGRDVLIEYGNTNGTYTSGTTLQALGTTVYGLSLLNWRDANDTLGTDEIALLSPQGVEIREIDGAYLKGVNWTLSPILATVIKDQDTSVQRLALVAKFNGVDRLSMFGDIKSESAVALGAVGVVSMAAADADGDGDTELFLSVNTDVKFSRHNNLSPAASTFNVSAVTKYAYGSPDRNPALSRAGLAPGDFDSDTKLDILAPAQGNPPPGGPLHVYGSVPLVRVENPGVAAYRIGVDQVIYYSVPKQVQFRFTAPATLLPADAGTRKMSVKIWHTTAFGIGTFKAPYYESLELVPTPNNPRTILVNMPAGYSLANSNDLFSLVVRQQIVDANNNVLDIAPAMTGIFTAEPNVAVIANAPETTHTLPIALPPPHTEPTVGGLDLGPTVPSLADDEEPEDRDQRP